LEQKLPSTQQPPRRPKLTSDLSSLPLQSARPPPTKAQREGRFESHLKTSNDGILSNSSEGRGAETRSALVPPLSDLERSERRRKRKLTRYRCKQHQRKKSTVVHEKGKERRREGNGRLVSIAKMVERSIARRPTALDFV